MGPHAQKCEEHKRKSASLGIELPSSGYDGARNAEDNEDRGDEEDGDAHPAAGRVRGLQDRDVDEDGRVVPKNIDAVPGLEADVGQEDTDARHHGLKEEVREDLDELPANVPVS